MYLKWSTIFLKVSKWWDKNRKFRYFPPLDDVQRYYLICSNSSEIKKGDDPFILVVIIHDIGVSVALLYMSF